MAHLAGSLRQLFKEIDAAWPNRDRRTDGWIGDAAHQARQSDHNPDERGIVHAIDIDADGVHPQYIIDRVARPDRPTAYVIYDRKIWSRTRGFAVRNYTGSNPHTGHIHVSILYGTDHESDLWEWEIADLGKETGTADRPPPADDMWDWAGHFDGAASWNLATADALQHAANGLIALAR